MKIKIKNTIPFDYADMLIEKYYEGTTSCEEEDTLRKFLCKKDLPDKYNTEKAIFEYLGKGRQSKKKKIGLNLLYRGIAASVILVIGLIVYNHTKVGDKTIAYIDGIKITDKEQIKSLASNSLYNVLSENNLAEEQLSLFSGIEFDNH